MGARYLTEQDVRELVSMQDAIDVCERAFRNLAESTATNQPRARLRTNSAMMHLLAGADQSRSELGWKIYTTTRQQARFLVGIYDGGSGELTTLIEADYMGQLRTGAASGVATQYWATPNSSQLGLIGTGLQAWTQALAVACVRKLKQVLVYGRDAERRTEFARKLSEELQLEVIPAVSSGQLARESDIVVTATTSKTPVFDGNDLQPGTHLNAIGGNFLRKSELDLETFRRVDRICCDSQEQCKLEAGEFVAPLDAGMVSWDQISELGHVIVNNIPRDGNDITLFKSVGLGIQDVALGTLISARAREQGRGIELPF